jgi:hypothetical protein
MGRVWEGYGSEVRKGKTTLKLRKSVGYGSVDDASRWLWAHRVSLPRGNPASPLVEGSEERLLLYVFIWFFNVHFFKGMRPHS